MRRMFTARVRGFTLVELIVVLIAIGVLATIASVAYTQVTDRAHVTRAQTDLRNVAQAVLVAAAVENVDVLDRALVTGTLEDSLGASVTDGIGAVSYRLGYADQAPQGPADLSVGFDSGDGVISDAPGSRAVLTTADASGVVYAVVVTWSGLGEAGTYPVGTAPQDVTLDGADPVTDPEEDEGGVPFGGYPGAVYVLHNGS